VELLRTCFNVTGGEAKRLLAQNAVSVDEDRVTDPNSHIMPRDGMVVKLGKRRYARVKLKEQ
jgi:tyrosyl-tRNA synthetase